MNPRIILLIFLLIVCIKAYPQSAGKILYQRGNNLLTKNPDSAGIVFREGASLLLKEKNYNLYVACYLGLGTSKWYLEQYDSLYFFTNRSLEMAEKYLGIYNGTYNVSLNNLSVYFSLLGNHLKAADLIKKAIGLAGKTTFLDGSVNDYYLEYYKNIGIVYKTISDYHEALRYFQKGISLWEDEFAVKDTLKGEYGILRLEEAKVHYRLKDYLRALHSNQIARNYIMQNQNPYSNDIKIDLQHNAALIFQKMGVLDSAKFYIDLAFEYQKRFNLNMRFVTYRILSNQAILENNLALAEKHSVRALVEAKARFAKRYGSSYISRAHQELGDVYFLRKKFREAEEQYRLAIETIVPLPEGKISMEAFAPEALSHSTELSKGFFRIGKAQWNQYLIDADTEILQKSFQSLTLATQLIPAVYRQFQNEDSRLFMAEQSISVFEHAIKASLELYKRTAEDSFLHQAFAFSEQNKAALLYQALKDSEYKQTIGIPDSVLQKEQEVKSELTFYRGKVHKENLKGAKGDQKKLDYWRNKIFELEEVERRLSSDLKEQFPRYYALKYQTNNISVDTIQKRLSPEKAMVAYFNGDSTTYAFVITQSEISAIEISNHDSLENWINQMREGLYHFWMSPEQTPELYQTSNQKYVDHAFLLYQNLIQPMTDSLGLSATQLMIIPDGALGYIPFDALLKSKPQNSGYFATHDYLVNHYQISYAYSATLWGELLDHPQEPAKKDLLAVGPSFPKAKRRYSSVEKIRRDGFGPLLFNQKEVGQISRLFSSTELLGNEATKTSFTDLAQDYRFIHLSTHAKAEDSDSRFSRIAFTPIPDSTEENDFLTLAEICNLNLNAEMVVLSACETALGELKKGEGIMSLARAFTYAGTRSIITTLWSVDDEATSQLMADFYQYLTEGKTKDAALRQARLDYLGSHDNRFSHPFFWAAAVPMGNMEAIDMRSQVRWGYVVLLLITVVGVSVFFWGRAA
jgi:CHAT domain-containing protein